MYCPSDKFRRLWLIRERPRQEENAPPSYFVGGVNWCSHHGKQHGGSSKTSKQSCHTTQQCHLHIPGRNYNSKRYTYPYIHRSTVTTAKTWKPKCPFTDEWIKKMWYIYTMEYYSATTKSVKMPFTATWIDPEIVILSEVSLTKKDKYQWYCLWVES